ncbi:MAG: hypothetical protein ACD_75C02453G0002 [uncultured bacterium]|nr:MAG: hypothetical protein ACD_75C02453G0002 [uncultured bacterium]
MKEAGNGNANSRQYLNGPFILLQGTVAHVPGAQHQHRIEAHLDGFRPGVLPLFLQLPGRGGKIPPVDEPELRGDDHPVGEEDDAKGGNGRCEVRRHEDMMVAQRLLQVEQKRQRRAGKKREGKDERKAGNVLQLLDSEHMVK